MTTDAARRGAGLEVGVERFLSLHGYTCRRNAVVEGRSGARHEVDVLAERTDGVTTYRLAVECKARAQPADKEVVAKLSFVVDDLGLHQGIVASVTGCTVGARRSARELGVELWGPAELEARLGRVALTELSAGPPPQLGDALPVACPPELAGRYVRRDRRRHGAGRERLESLGLVWVPHELLLVASTGYEPTRFGRGAERVTWSWNLYETVSGTFVLRFDAEPEVVQADLAVALAPGVPNGRVAADIRRAAERRSEVTTPAARDRYVRRLESLGVPGQARSVTVEVTRPLAYPYYLGLLTTGGRARVAAVDAHLARRDPAMAGTLTGTIDRVRQALA